MSITNKGELRTAILNELVWDSEMADRADEWIKRTTDTLSRDLRVNQMLSSETGSLTSGSAALAVPSDYMGTETFYLTNAGASSTLTLVTPVSLEQTVPNNATGLPTHFAIIGSNFRLKPLPDSAYAYTHIYYARIAALTGDADTNWVLDNHTDAYLYGALTFASLYTSDARKQDWSVLYQNAVAGIEQDSERRQFPIGNIQITLDATVV